MNKVYIEYRYLLIFDYIKNSWIHEQKFEKSEQPPRPENKQHT